VPDTLITTDADAVRGFRARHGTVIYKSISGVRSIVSQLTPDHEGRLADVAWCPTQFQQYVPGADYRVHVAGSEVFCARIESVADDYRYGARQGAEMSMNAACLPDDWPQRCRALAADMGLALAGIDLRCTPDGEWYCFEVNPSPAFTYYDRFGQGIAGTVARLLTGTGASA
jgi:glutathione synthase/RimK-type ligase-like ATP-grasp enzyme